MHTYKARSSYAKNSIIKQIRAKELSNSEQMEIGTKIDKAKPKKNTTNIQQKKTIVVKTKLKEPFKDKLLTDLTKDYWLKYNKNHNKEKKAKVDYYTNYSSENFTRVPIGCILTDLIKSNDYNDDTTVNASANDTYDANCNSQIDVSPLPLPVPLPIPLPLNKSKTNTQTCLVRETKTQAEIKQINWNINPCNTNDNNSDVIKPNNDITKKKTSGVLKVNNDIKDSNNNYSTTSNTNNYNSNTLLIPVEDPEYFSNEEDRLCELTDDEKHLYGNRELKHHKRKKLLGKGGCGIVWLCECNEPNRLNDQCAVKQVSKRGINANHCRIAKNEIEILTKLNNATKAKCPYIIDIFNSYEDNQDIWFSLERGGKSLSSLVFKIKGEFLDSERIYSIKKGLFLKQLLTGKLTQFKVLIRSLLEAISFISSNGIIHSDLKPENILVEYNGIGNNEEDFRISSVKVIDFGSAFYSTNPSSFNSNTPEYMCPEIIELLELTSFNKEKAKFLSDLVDYPWVVDIWSLGITLLELVTSCPIWMSFKAKVIIQGKTIYKTGLFGIKNRDGTKINQKQKNLHKEIHKILMQSLIADCNERSLFEDLLKQMLNPEYKKRLSPDEALNHQFLVI